ncbi:MAG: flavin reductase family protein [bacterium]|nr:flavin reductase family protein [bacterium]
MAFESMEQRRIMGCFATGVTVVTTVVEGKLHGMTANAVASLSLDPPLVMVSVNRQSHMHTSLIDGQCFAMNILEEGQEELSNRFAAPGPKDFSDLSVRTAETGAPVLDDALGYVDCRVVNVLQVGDHDIFVGEIVAGDAGDGRPLMYYKGQYRKLDG